MSVFQVNSQAGKPIFSGGIKITPISQAVRLQLPGAPFAFSWNRPVAVVVQTEKSAEQVLPVHDLTRTVQIAIAGLTLFSVALLLILKRT